MTDASARGQAPTGGGYWAAAPGPASPWASPSYGPASAGGRPAADSWWSDALADPWRDPQARAVVVTTPAVDGPELEPLPAPAGPRRGASVGIVALISVITALLAGALGGTLGYFFAVGNGTGSGTRLGADGKAGPLTDRAPQSVAALVKKVLPSVVTLRVNSGNGASLGSGFVVSPDGYVVTNNHVVEGGTGPILVTFSDATTAQGSIVGSDPESDLAVIKTSHPNLTPVAFGDSDALQVGDPVVAVGAPLALSNTVTLGIISALDRPLRTDDEAGGVRYYAAIQTDAAVNQGNSGGPLFDASGRVVGVNSVIGSLAEDQEHAGNVGLAFAIPINQTKRVAQDIIDRGRARRTVIGAQVDESYSSGGARLSAIEAGGPAASAGLRVGDVISKVESAVVDEPWDLVALIRKYQPGATVAIAFNRDGGQRTIRVTLAADDN